MNTHPSRIANREVWTSQLVLAVTREDEWHLSQNLKSLTARQLGKRLASKARVDQVGRDEGGRRSVLLPRLRLHLHLNAQEPHQ